VGGKNTRSDGSKEKIVLVCSFVRNKRLVSRHQLLKGKLPIKGNRNIQTRRSNRKQQTFTESKCKRRYDKPYDIPINLRGARDCFKGKQNPLTLPAFTSTDTEEIVTLVVPLCCRQKPNKLTSVNTTSKYFHVTFTNISSQRHITTLVLQ
jgi:hypothetical protein